LLHRWSGAFRVACGSIEKAGEIADLRIGQECKRWHATTRAAATDDGRNNVSVFVAGDQRVAIKVGCAAIETQMSVAGRAVCQIQQPAALPFGRVVVIAVGQAVQVSARDRDLTRGQVGQYAKPCVFQVSSRRELPVFVRP
jgi:prophage tail gpP-like protein